MSQESTGSIILPPSSLATGSPAGQALENINTFVLGDGALCYVQTGAGQGAWQLEKGATDAPNGTTIVAPISGPGRWFKKLSPGVPTPPAPALPAPILVDIAVSTTAPGTVTTFQTYPGDYLYLVNFQVYVGNGPAPYEGAPLRVGFLLDATMVLAALIGEFRRDNSVSSVDNLYLVNVTGQFRLSGVHTVNLLCNTSGIDQAPVVSQVATSSPAKQLLVTPIYGY